MISAYTAGKVVRDVFKSTPGPATTKAVTGMGLQGLTTGAFIYYRTLRVMWCDGDGDGDMSTIPDGSSPDKENRIE